MFSLFDLLDQFFRKEVSFDFIHPLSWFLAVMMSEEGFDIGISEQKFRESFLSLQHVSFIPEKGRW